MEHERNREPRVDVAARLDAITAELKTAHVELDTAMEQRRAALNRITQVHLARLEANRRAEQGADRSPPPG